MAQSITVDLTPDGRRIFQRPTLYFSQGDVGRPFEIVLVSRFGQAIPAGATVKIEATKPSGLGFSEAGTLSSGTASFTTATIMTDEAGTFPVEVTITASGVVWGTANFNMCVEPDPHPEGTTDGESEQVIPVITALVERVEAAVESMHELSVEAVTQNYGTAATATYDEELNKITFGIPRGNLLTYTDANSDGNIVITKS